MSLVYTYAGLAAELQAYTLDSSTDFVADLPNIIAKGELRLYKDLDLDALDYSVVTPSINALTGLVSKPANLIRDRTASAVTTTAPTGYATSLLLHFDGTAGNTSIVDATGNNVPVTSGLAAIETTQVKFGTGALNLPSTATAANTYVTMPIVANGPLDILGAADFTI